MQPLDFTVLSEAAATPVPHRETTETLYSVSQIFCVKGRIPVILLNCPLHKSLSVRECECRQEEGESQVFIQDLFNPVLSTEDAERHADVCNLGCALTSYKYRKDILELEEGDVILILDVLQHINKVVTIAEAAETVDCSR